MKNLSVSFSATLVILIILFYVGPMVVNGQESSIPFDSAAWEIISGNVKEISGRKAFAGTAFLKETEGGDGTIEFDMLVNGKRSYPGVIFRMSEPGNYERVYFRPHLPAFFQNVVQYCGTFNDIDSWQLYSGDGYIAGAALVKNEWFHVKVDIFGSQARVFLNNQPEPSLFIRHLAHGNRTGRIGVISAEDGSAFFSAFSWKSNNKLVFPPETEEETPFGVIREWQISQSFRMNSVDNERVPDEQGIRDINWSKVSCRPDGIVDISRYLSRSGNLPDVIFAKTTLEADADTAKLFAFGYSDVISVFLNGKLLFAGNSAYTSRDPTFQGIVGLNDYIVLPLKKGKNELMIALTESFGGWGFIFRDARAVYMDRSLKKIREIRSGFALPESAVYDKKRDVVYISSYYNEGQEYISKVAADGTVISAVWVTGIMQPTGLCLSGDKLYAVGRYALIEIDPETGTILRRIRFPEPGMPNDVTADEKGNLYITDSQRNLIYRCAGGEMEVWMQDDQLVKPNGILFDQGNLLVGTSGDGCIKRIDPETKATSAMVCLGEGAIMDGITPDGKGGYLISDYNGKIFRINVKGDKQLLMDATAPPKHCADFLFIPGKRLLIVPGFVDNTVTTYEIAID